MAINTNIGKKTFCHLFQLNEDIPDIVTTYDRDPGNLNFKLKTLDISKWSNIDIPFCSYVLTDFVLVFDSINVLILLPDSTNKPLLCLFNLCTKKNKQDLFQEGGTSYKSLLHYIFK